ncbi:MAG: response regulator [Candidatus Sericytochromatia bacterium]
MNNKKILIVEDERIVAIDIKSTLEAEGFEIVDIVISGEAAIEKAIELKPDLILMDIFLRGSLNGIEASKKIKENMDIPIIYLTAYEDKATIDKAKETNPVEYLVKPFEEDVLIETIKRVLQ